MTDTQSLDNIVKRLNLLGDQVRLRMLRILAREELSVGEVASVLQTPQSTASRHLKVLTAGGWLSRRSERTATFYRLIRDDLSEVELSLWDVLRPEFDAIDEAGSDDQRLIDVLRRRSTDSMSFFGRLAGEWDALRGELFGDRFTANGLLSLIPPNWTVADIGCGTGNATALLAPHIDRVIAIDQSGPMLDAAKRRLEIASGARDNVTFIQGPAESLPLPNASVDAVVCSLVLHHVETPVDAIAEMRRVLRPARGGGVALVIDMERHQRREYRDQMGHHHLGFSAEDTRSMFAEAGFDSVRLTHLPADTQGKGPGLFAATARIKDSLVQDT